MEDAVMISSEINDGTYSIEDSADFDIVGKGAYGVEGIPPPSLNTATRMEDLDKSRYEQRIDIIETQNLKEEMKTKLQFFEKEKIDEVLKRINARVNLDQEMDNEIKNLEELAKNKDHVNVLLVTAIDTGLVNIKETQIIAKDGKTTLKRAMEIIKAAFPVFLSAWSKAQEKFELDHTVDEELEKFEAARQEVADAGLNIDKRMEKTDEFKVHIAKAIEYGEEDVGKIVKKRNREINENRKDQCLKSKEEIDVIVHSEIEEVDAWQMTCKGDKEVLSKFTEEQINRHDTAYQQHLLVERRLEKDIELNKKQQQEFKKKLQNLEEEEKKMDKELSFQRQVQEKATQLHNEIINDMGNRQEELTAIETRADTARKVVELMTNCGNALINSSMKAEEIYLHNLEELEKESKQRLRGAVVNSAVEMKIKLENSSRNIQDCEEEMRILKEDLEKAAKQQNKLKAEKRRKEYEEYKTERKREKKLVADCSKELQILEMKLEKLDEDLKLLDVGFLPFDEIYNLRMQELLNTTAGGSFSSMESDNEDEETFEDAE